LYAARGPAARAAGDCLAGPGHSRPAATLLDFAQRGFILIEEIPGDDDRDWLLTDLRDPAETDSGLLRFEGTLLDGLFARRSPARLGELGQDLIPANNRTRSQLDRDAVRRGWLRRWRHHQRTPHGEQRGYSAGC
jgi:hypothetical protein